MWRASTTHHQSATLFWRTVDTITCTRSTTGTRGDAGRGTAYLLVSADKNHFSLGYVPASLPPCLLLSLPPSSVAVNPGPSLVLTVGRTENQRPASLSKGGCRHNMELQPSAVHPLPPPPLPSATFSFLHDPLFTNVSVQYFCTSSISFLIFFFSVFWYYSLRSLVLDLVVTSLPTPRKRYLDPLQPSCLRFSVTFFFFNGLYT